MASFFSSAAKRSHCSVCIRRKESGPPDTSSSIFRIKKGGPTRRISGIATHCASLYPNPVVEYILAAILHVCRVAADVCDHDGLVDCLVDCNRIHERLCTPSFKEKRFTSLPAIDILFHYFGPATNFRLKGVISIQEHKCFNSLLLTGTIMQERRCQESLRTVTLALLQEATFLVIQHRYFRW